MEKKLTKTLSVLKALPPALAKIAANDDNGQWVWATREITDSVGDVIRVDGVDFSDYHNPPDTRLKILAQHLRALADGTAPVVATVENVVKTTTLYKGKPVKGIALYCKWLRDAATNELLPLAAHYKQMVDAGGIDSVSVGLIVNEAQPYEETGGMDITSSTIYETSYVTIAANAAANLVKEMIDEKAAAIDAERTKEIVPCECEGDACEVAACCTRNKKNPQEKQSETSKSVSDPDAHTQLVKGYIEQSMLPMTDAIKHLTEVVRSFEQRIDVIESAIVVSADAKVQAQNNQKEELTPDQIKMLHEKVKSLIGYLK